MTKKKTMLQSWRQLLAEDWRFFRNHGASLEAYISRYGRGDDPEPPRIGDGGERIFEADLEGLRKKIARVMDMASRKPSRRPRWTVRDDGKAVRFA